MIGAAAVRILSGARKILQIPIVAILVTLGLIAGTTWVIVTLRDFVEPDRPFTILYLLPVAVGAALLGIWWGIFFAFTTLLCAQIFLFSHHGYLLPVVDLSNSIEDASLAVGVFVIAIVTGRLRSALELLHSTNGQIAEANHNLAEVNSKLVESEQQRRAINRDVLQAVTAGKLMLVEPEDLSHGYLPERSPTYEQELFQPKDASRLRQCLQDLALQQGLDPSRIQDLCTSVTEAATNAINHGAGGRARGWIDKTSVVVLIQDNGAGIAPANLARATLEKGFSTRVSLGMGFFLILDTVDTLVLSTTPQGTSLVLTILNGPRVADGDALLARYAAVNL